MKYHEIPQVGEVIEQRKRGTKTWQKTKKDRQLDADGKGRN